MYPMASASNIGYESHNAGMGNFSIMTIAVITDGLDLLIVKPADSVGDLRTIRPVEHNDITNR